ncbi:hypothetical protein MTR67_047574 [Solanum verrucosum]|uniref:ALBINO3-like protein 2, chloroplastic n=1 Tax=Solanum verrucosum TaxID=315347 RepID=A0AAF0UYS2_SOLVR|nr:hypothetical protein MTR67_047574 [Solanum verrucosum]
MGEEATWKYFIKVNGPKMETEVNDDAELLKALAHLADKDLLGRWIIIASSAVAMRLTLFPFVILQLHKLKRILELLPKLPPPLPPPMSRRSFRDQLKIFFKEKRAAGCPSFFWYFATLTVQVPCFFLWITTITRMSLYHHEGFDCERAGERSNAENEPGKPTTSFEDLGGLSINEKNALDKLSKKRKGAIELKDFRPISLIGSVYKILAKVLAESLIEGDWRKVVPFLSQKKKSGTFGLLFKLDIKKAFDKLNRSSLISILRQMEFGERPLEHVLFSLWTDLGHAKLFERGFCVLEFLESWEDHQNDLVFSSCLYFVVHMDRGEQKGGILWFQNLTEFPSGVLGPVFPLLIAGLHYINIQVSFQKSSVEKMSGPVGLIAKYYQKYLGVLTLVILFVTFNMPQGSLVFWLTNSSMTVIQQLSLKHPDVRKKLGLPQKDPQLEGAHPKELVNPGEIKIDPSKNQSKISVQNLSPQELVNLSIKHLAGGRKDEAMSFLRLAIAKDPENVRALLIIGQTLLQDGSLPEATEYLERTIAKLLLKENQKEIEDVDLLILSSQWAGVACILQGKMGEGLAHLERIATLKEPDDPKSKAHYYDGLVLLSSTLINAGRKKDAINYLQMATAYDESYREFLQQCENEEDVISNDLATRRRRD